MKLFKVRENISDWLSTRNYVINIVYKDLLGSKPIVSWCKVVWNRCSIPKARFFFWMVMLNRLKTRDRLKAVGVLVDDICPICGEVSESIDHIFFSMPMEFSMRLPLEFMASDEYQLTLFYETKQMESVQV